MFSLWSFCEDIGQIISSSLVLHHSITFVDDEVFNFLKNKVLISHQLENSSRTSDDDLGLILLQILDRFFDGLSSKIRLNLNMCHILGESSELVSDLHSQFSDRSQNQTCSSGIILSD